MSAAAVERVPVRWGFAEVVVFVAGISTLGAEIAAARLVAPAFGASTVVWANTIAIVLVGAGRSATGSAAGSPTAIRTRAAMARGGAARRGAGRADPAASRSRCWASTEDSLGEFGRLAGSRSSCSSRRRCWCSARCRRGRSGCACDSVDGAGDVTGRLYALSTAGGLVGNFAAALALIPLGRHALDVPASARRCWPRSSAPGGMVLQACLNGDRESGVPRTPEELARGSAGVRRGGRGLAPRAPARPRRARDARRRAHRRGGARAARRRAAGRDLALDRAVDHGRRRRRAAAGDRRSGPSVRTSSR